MLEKLLLTAIKSVIDAGLEILNIYDKDFSYELKKDQSPLTIADKKANDIIISLLSKTNIPIISEETKIIDYAIRKKWNTCWIVDPLDGTKEFIKKNGEFTVNIALIENGITVIGVIYVPVTKELFYTNTSKDKAYKISIDSFSSFKLYGKSTEIKPFKNAENELIIVGSRSHMNDDTKKYLESFKAIKTKIVSKGSSLKFCLVAEGKASIYPRFAPTMEWDTAAGQAICEAVGVDVISKETNKALLYNKENLLNPHFIVQ